MHCAYCIIISTYNLYIDKTYRDISDSAGQYEKGPHTHQAIIMKVSTSSVLAPLVFAASAYAQLFTTTFPWAVRFRCHLLLNVFDVTIGIVADSKLRGG